MCQRRSQEPFRDAVIRDVALARTSVRIQIFFFPLGQGSWTWGGCRRLGGNHEHSILAV